MSPTDTQNLILTGATTFGTSVLVILASLIVIIIGYLVFRKGINALLYDQSLQIFGFYVRKTPYKGYNRFRSMEWNMKNTM